jgi:site-specific DNA recombinase
LEDIFHHQLKDFFFSTTEITNYLSQADKVIKDKEELLKTVRDEKKNTEQDMEKIYRAYTSGEISIEGFGRFYKPLEERLKQIDDQIPEIQGEIDFLKIQYISSDQIFNEAKDLYSRWPQLTSEEKRKIIENITENIKIGKEDVTIHLTYRPSSFELMVKGQQNARDSWPRRA